MRVVPQLYEDAELTEDSSGKKTLVQRFDVQDIEAATIGAAMYAALLADGIPRKGDPMPDIPGLYCTEVRARPWAPTDASVWATWGVPSLSIPQSEDVLRIEGGAMLREQQTQKDRDGNPLTINFKPEGGNWQKAQGGSVSQFFSYPQLRFTRKEKFSPEQKLMFCGKLNANRWRDKYPPHTWMLADIPFQGILGQQGYSVTYVFVSDPYDGFAPIIRWKDPGTGRPPYIKPENVAQNLADRNGIAKADQQYFELDFEREFGF